MSRGPWKGSARLVPYRKRWTVRDELLAARRDLDEEMRNDPEGHELRVRCLRGEISVEEMEKQLEELEIKKS